jgi:uncharacterized membrane protein
MAGVGELSDTGVSLEGLSIQSRITAVRVRSSEDRGEASVALRAVYGGAAAYAVLFAFAAVLHYIVFETARADLGNMVQPIWNTLHGHFLETTTLNGYQRNRLGYHVDPFLLLLAPILWIWSSPVLLPVAQALAVASGALPVFWLARKHLGSPRAAAHFAFAYLLYPATQFNAFTISSSFHSVAIAVPLVLYAVWFLDADRLVAFSAVALLASTTKEEIPLAVGCLGVWYAVRSGRRLFGLSVFGAGLGLTLFNFLWVIPHFAASGVEPFAGRYSAVGGTPGGIAQKVVTDPAAFLHAIATGHKATYLALLLLPFLGLWLLEPLLFLGAVPDLVINLLSNKSDQTSIPYHWTAGIVPFVVAASIFGAARFKRHAVRVSLWALVGAASLAVYSPVYFITRDVPALRSRLNAAKAHAIGLIPAGVSVAASNQLAGHLSERRYIYTFPFVGRARWILVDRGDETYADANGYQRAIRNYEARRVWRIVYASRGVTVLHRRATRRRWR